MKHHVQWRGVFMMVLMGMHNINISVTLYVAVYQMDSTDYMTNRHNLCIIRLIQI